MRHCGNLTTRSSGHGSSSFTRTHGDGQLGSPSFDIFHRTKSIGLRLSSTTSTRAPACSLLNLRDSPQDQCESVNALIDEHIHHVKARIDGLLALQTQLLDLRQRCGEGPNGEHCGILQQLEVSGSVSTPEGEPSHVGRSHGH